MKNILLIGAGLLGAYGLYQMMQKKNEKSEAPKGTSLLPDKEPVKSIWPKKIVLMPNEVLDEFSTKFTDIFPTPRKGVETPGAAATDGMDTKLAQEVVEM